MTVHTCTYMYAYQQSVELHMETARSTSLVPRCRGGGGERAPGTHCLRMGLITTNSVAIVFVRVRTRILVTS